MQSYHTSPATLLADPAMDKAVAVFACKNRAEWKQGGYQSDRVTQKK